MSCGVVGYEKSSFWWQTAISLKSVTVFAFSAKDYSALMCSASNTTKSTDSQATGRVVEAGEVVGGPIVWRRRVKPNVRLSQCASVTTPKFWLTQTYVLVYVDKSKLLLHSTGMSIHFQVLGTFLKCQYTEFNLSSRHYWHCLAHYCGIFLPNSSDSFKMCSWPTPVNRTYEYTLCGRFQHSPGHIDHISIR